ncbi:hypothetical protein AOA80_06880 [Methanomassiliicoccales archaeon RumEn M1]|nr:hypothetical protein AOA80_06880 [Methanomassiliicoccales archaeon RumEn M1]
MRPMMNAPMAMDSPMRLDVRAMRKHSPRATMSRTSGSYLFPIQLRMGGMSLLPSSRLKTTKITMPNTIRAMLPRAGASPTSRGAAMERMMTCPRSSMTVIVVDVDLTSSSMSFRPCRQATTTAVLVPDITAPRKIEATLSSPMARPAR